MTWPTPGRLIFGRRSRNEAPWVSGSMQTVLTKLYQDYYPHQSGLAHQRIAAVSVAMIVDQPEAQWNPGHGESHHVLTAVLLLSCLPAEIQAAAQYDRHPKLAEVWAYLKETNDDTRDLWDMRYEKLVAPVETSA